jgi:hypothetical protein
MASLINPPELAIVGFAVRSLGVSICLLLPSPRDRRGNRGWLLRLIRRAENFGNRLGQLIDAAFETTGVFAIRLDKRSHLLHCIEQSFLQLQLPLKGIALRNQVFTLCAGGFRNLRIQSFNLRLKLADLGRRFRHHVRQILLLRRLFAVLIRSLAFLLCLDQ